MFANSKRKVFVERLQLIINAKFNSVGLLLLWLDFFVFEKTLIVLKNGCFYAIIVIKAGAKIMDRRYSNGGKRFKHNV